MKCFVIIGYGEKVSYANGKQRKLNLDQTYKYLIKPVFDKLEIECFRAIDKNLSGSIDKLMLQEIKDADLAIADLSTLNANVMWELGVRHALKPHHTILICEKEQMASIPFDVGSFVVHEYVHSEAGIPITEVETFPEKLTKVVQGLINQHPPQIDSPVFTFLDQKSLFSDVAKMDDGETFIEEKSFAQIMDAAEDFKNHKKYTDALNLFNKAREIVSSNMSLSDNMPFITNRIALCTYKAALPDEVTALQNALEIVNTLHPDESLDDEVLGISAAIHKRLYDLGKGDEHLDAGIKYCERGFQLKQSYYNGINAAFMIYQKTAILKAKGLEWEDTKLKADYIRNAVLEITTGLAAKPKFMEDPDAIWVLLTIAEVYHYKGKMDKMTEYENEAAKLNKDGSRDFAIDSYQKQKESINEILNQIN